MCVRSYQNALDFGLYHILFNHCIANVWLKFNEEGLCFIEFQWISYTDWCGLHSIYYYSYSHSYQPQWCNSVSSLKMSWNLKQEYCQWFLYACCVISSFLSLLLWYCNVYTNTYSNVVRVRDWQVKLLPDLEGLDGV